MTPLFKKLNLKDHSPILVLNAPDSFRDELEAISAFTEVVKDGKVDSISFAMVFVTTQSEIDASILSLAPKFDGDVVLWYCYPKGSSKNYTCDFNRDTGWATLGKYDLEGVRQVAIDADWSALRFRKIDYIKNFKRRKEMALSEKGKKRVDNR